MKKSTLLNFLGLLLACVLWAGVYTYIGWNKSNAGFNRIDRRLHDPSLLVFFLDVGQGDATLIITPERKTVLIDSGPASPNFGYGWDGAEQAILPVLFALGIHHLDGVIITHSDIDHMGGIFTLLEQVKVDHIYTNGYVHPSYSYRQFLNRIQERGIPLHTLKMTDSLTLGQDVQAQVLSPDETLSFDHNDLSLVLRIVYKSMDLLLVGDIERLTEYQLCLRYGDQLKCDVLKVPHHGSKTSSSELFINWIHPKIAVCSSGRNNTYGHPVAYIIERYRKICQRVYRTDIHGHVLLVSDGLSGWIWSQNTQPCGINFSRESKVK